MGAASMDKVIPVLQKIDGLEAKFQFIHARARTTGIPFASLLLDLCEEDAIKFDAEKVVASISRWPGEQRSSSLGSELEEEDFFAAGDTGFMLNPHFPETRLRLHPKGDSEFNAECAIANDVAVKVLEVSGEFLKVADDESELKAEGWVQHKNVVRRQGMRKANFNASQTLQRHKDLIDDLRALCSMRDAPMGTATSTAPASASLDVRPHILIAYAQSDASTSLPAVLRDLVQARVLVFNDTMLCAAVDFGTDASNTKAWGAEAMPTFLSIRDRRGRMAKMCFIGEVAGYEQESSAHTVLCDCWGLGVPSTAIVLDAGTMHPRHCDVDLPDGSSAGLASLPKFQHFLAEAGEHTDDTTLTPGKVAPHDRRRSSASSAGDTTLTPGKVAPHDRRRSSAKAPKAAPAPNRSRAQPPPLPQSTADVVQSVYTSPVRPLVRHSGQEDEEMGLATLANDLVVTPAHEWPMDDDTPDSTPPVSPASDYHEGDEGTMFRLNDLIHDKMLNVFTALVDAATLSNSWIVVDRTISEGGYSATAEFLLELALERGSRRPTIIVIDSLQRLQEASNVESGANDIIKDMKDNGVDPKVLALLPRTGQRSYRIHNQLRKVYQAAKVHADATRSRGDEFLQPFDFFYKVGDYATADGPFGSEPGLGYSAVPDKLLPFEVVAEHKNENDECDAYRKWAYFYDDSMFSSGTHYIIKNKDIDVFNLDSVAGSRSFLYAHGDRRTSERLRDHVQQGQQIVMLYNSGGVVQPLSWLQRVMGHAHRPPSILRMREPLSLILQAVPSAWGLVGVPEMLLFQTLAERAPYLFRKNIVSVDLLNDNDEKMLQIITGCFSSGGSGVPELGLGNAEINVTYAAWSLVRSLTQNSRWFSRASGVMQTTLRLIAFFSTLAAIVSGGAIDKYIPQGHYLRGEYYADTQAATIDSDGGKKYYRWNLHVYADMTITILPVLAAFFTTVVGRMKWFDKWSLCYTSAANIESEIYLFRMGVDRYNPHALMRGAVHADSPDAAGGDADSTATMKRLARNLFSERCQELYSVCLEQMSDGASMFNTRKKLLPEHRAAREARYSFPEWLSLKMFIEHKTYGARWGMPLDDLGLDFSVWITGLRPYVENTLQDELLTLLEDMQEEELIDLEQAAKHAGGEKRRLREFRIKLEQRLQVRRNSLKAKHPQDFKDVVLEAIRTAKEELKMTNHNKKEQDGLSMLAGLAVPDITRMTKMTSMKGQDMLSKPARKTTSRSGSASRGKAKLANDGALQAQEREAARRALCELVGESSEPGKSQTQAQNASIFEAVEDDYLVGPLSVESYVVFRTRPILEMLEKRARVKAILLQLIEVFIFFIQMCGTIFAASGLGVWVALTVTIAALMSGVLGTTNLRNKVVSSNSAVQLLSSKVTWWDAQTLVMRRAAGTRRMMVEATETAYMRMIDGGASAASSVIEAKTEDDDNADEHGHASHPGAQASGQGAGSQKGDKACASKAA